jgi:hypothetical protein
MAQQSGDMATGLEPMNGHGIDEALTVWEGSTNCSGWQVKCTNPGGSSGRTVAVADSAKRRQVLPSRGPDIHGVGT